MPSPSLSHATHPPRWFRDPAHPGAWHFGPTSPTAPWERVAPCGVGIANALVADEKPDGRRCSRCSGAEYVLGPWLRAEIGGGDVG